MVGFGKSHVLLVVLGDHCNKGLLPRWVVYSKANRGLDNSNELVRGGTHNPFPDTIGETQDSRSIVTGAVGKGIEDFFVGY